MDKTFWGLVEDTKARENKPSFYFENQPKGEKRLNFSNFREETELVSYNLKKMDIGPGDKVLVVSENSPQFIESVYAINRMGAVASVVDPGLKSEKMKHVASKFSPALTLSEEGISREKRDHLAKNSGDLVDIKNANKTKDTKTVIPDASPITNTRKLAFVLWTSGSMGDPKGVMISQRNITHNVEGVLELLKITHEDKIGSIAPWYHIMGFTCTLALPFITSTSIYYIAQILKILDTIGEKQISICLGAPKLFSKLIGMINRKTRNKIDNPFVLKAVEIYIRKKLGKNFRFLASGGTGLAPEVSKYYNKIKVTNLEGYGLTETGPILAMETIDFNFPGTVGLPLPNIQVRIVNPQTAKEITETGQENEGLIITSGEHVFLGYLKEPELTKAAFLYDWKVDNDRWFKTGDIGYFTLHNDKKILHISGRIDNRVAVSEGKNIQIEEIENLLNIPMEKSDLIEEFYIEDSYTNEGTILRAVVRPSDRGEKYIKRADNKLEKLRLEIGKEINQALQEKSAAKYERPRSVILVNKIVLTGPSQKIKRGQNPLNHQIKNEKELKNHFRQLKEEKRKKKRNYPNVL